MILKHWGISGCCCGLSIAIQARLSETEPDRSRISTAHGSSMRILSASFTPLATLNVITSRIRRCGSSHLLFFIISVLKKFTTIARSNKAGSPFSFTYVRTYYLVLRMRVTRGGRGGPSALRDLDTYVQVGKGRQSSARIISQHGAGNRICRVRRNSFLY